MSQREFSRSRCSLPHRRQIRASIALSLNYLKSRLPSSFTSHLIPKPLIPSHPKPRTSFGSYYTYSHAHPQTLVLSESLPQQTYQAAPSTCLRTANTRGATIGVPQTPATKHAFPPTHRRHDGRRPGLPLQPAFGRLQAVPARACQEHKVRP
jgi:hypothetical protein